MSFKCDERYTQGHVRKNKHFRILIIEDEPDVVQEGEWQDALEELGGTMQQLRLDYRSMVGQITIRSLRLWGEVAGRRVWVLIDSGASHNFICPKLVSEAELVVSPTSDFVVKVGNGHEVTSQGICKGVSLQFPELTVVQDCYLFPLEGSKVFWVWRGLTH